MIPATMPEMPLTSLWQSENIITLCLRFARFPRSRIGSGALFGTSPEGHELPAANLIDRRNSDRIGFQFRLPEQFPCVFVVPVKAAVGAGSDKDESASGHHRPIFRSAI